MASTSARSLAFSLDKLQIAGKSKNAEPADSWEDEAEENSNTTPERPTSSSGVPAPPPPTPSSPSYRSKTTTQEGPYQIFPPYGMDGAYDSPSGMNPNSAPAGRGSGEKRPEKSTAVASRLIAAGIGQKPVGRTKEQREYDQAMRLQEKRKRDQAKEEEERKRLEKERAKQAIWDD